MRALRVLDSATGASSSSVTVMSDAISSKETRNQDERELPKLHDVRLLHFGSKPSCLRLFCPLSRRVDHVHLAHQHSPTRSLTLSILVEC